MVRQLVLKEITRESVEKRLDLLPISILSVVRMEEMLTQETDELDGLLFVQDALFFLIDRPKQTLGNSSTLVCRQYLSLI